MKSVNYMKKYFLLFSVITHLNFVESVAQTVGTVQNNELMSIATPQAAEISRYNQIPVDLFNGLANVSIPLFQFPVKGSAVNINLSYHGGGVKPNTKGGGIGVGWSLNATGVITRIQNGFLDERVDNSLLPPYDKKGYFWNKSKLSRTDWETPLAVSDFLNSIYCQNGQGCSPIFDWAPDEFTFNFFGYSGSFWLDHLGNWVAKENNGQKLKVILDGNVDAVGYSYQYPQFPTSPTANNLKQVPYAFKGFTIIDANGNKFIFGNDPSNIELNRVSYGGTDLRATASSWYLKQIVTYLNETVNFEYERKYPTLSLNSSINSYEIQLANNYSAKTNFQVLGGVVQDPVYLKKILFSDYILSIDYTESPLAQYSPSALAEARLGVSKNNIAYDLDKNFYRYDDGSAVDPKDFKIDKISITNNNNVKRFTFEYYDQSIANRVFLKKITEGPIQSSQLVHQFEYNGTYFDPTTDVFNKFYDGYLTSKTDYWGFFNNKLPIETNLLPGNPNYQLSASNYFPSQALTDAYFANRMPNATAMLTGSLKKIIYPTGGNTEFIYEPNNYSKKINLNNYNTVSSGGDIIAGGLRIKEIKSYFDLTGTPLVKKYAYTNTDGTSSGVLNSAGIAYLESKSGTVSYGANPNASITYKSFYDASQYPLLNSNGNHVTYSRIEETMENGSKKVYEFSNHDDNRFTDIWPAFVTSGTQNFLYNLKSNSRQYARGKLLKESSYLIGNSIAIKTDDIIYENDINGVNNLPFLRTYTYKFKNIAMSNFRSADRLLGIGNYAVGSADVFDPSITPNRYYINTIRPIQKSVTEIRNSLPVIENLTYGYNDFNNKIKLQTFTNLSDGTSKSTRLYYPNDFLGTSVYDKMVLPSRNMLNPVVKSENYVGNSLLSTSKTNYAEFNNASLIMPATKESSIYSNSPKTDYTINSYDNNGNILEALPNTGVLVNYIWDDTYTFPIAEVSNGLQTQIAATSFETKASGNWTITSFLRDANSFTGIHSYNLVNGAISKSALQVGNIYTISYWSKNTLPYTITGGTTNISTGKTINGWTFYENIVTATETTISLSGSGLIDELRLHPKNNTLLMKTFTYNPLSGMTSQTDANRRVIFYEYDVFQRLVLIRDMDNNVIKKICYNYAGNPENCSTPIKTQLYGLNTTIQTWNITVASTTNTFTANYTIVPNTAAIFISNLPVDIYNITFTPISSSSISQVQLILNGVTYSSSTSFNVTNISIASTTTFTLQNQLPCAITIATNYVKLSSNIINNGSNVSCWITFFSNILIRPKISYTIATIEGNCRPSVIRTILYTSNNIDWIINIYPTGQMTCKLADPLATAIPAGTDITFSNFTYNL